MEATRPVHLILLNLITLIILGQEFKLRSSVFSNLLSLPASSSQIFSTPCSQIPTACVLPLMSEAK
jgi:hypothetical protein